jgi:hypothetical protein
MKLVSEPDPKRKTLAERAGETRSIAAPTPNSRALVRTTSLVSAGVSSPYINHSTKTRIASMADRRQLQKRNLGYGSPFRLGCILINMPSKEVGIKHYQLRMLNDS